MTPNEFYKLKPKDVVEDTAKKAGTTFGNFQQIALYGGSCSPALAKRLESASKNEMTVHEILFPEDSAA